MTTSDRHDDPRRTGDALDHLIDEAVESMLRAGPVDLRSQVLAGLDGGRAFAQDSAPEESPSHTSEGWFHRAVTGPTLLPVAGTLVMIAGVGILWQHANQQLGEATFHRGPASSTQAGAPTAPDRQVARLAPAEPAATTPPVLVRVPRRPRETRAKAPVWLESDSDQKVVDASALLAAGDLEQPELPGAPVGDFGDPVAPMPKPRPIVIQPLAPPPIPEAPPVSTLGKPVSTLSDEISRDRQDPGKPGGK